MSTGNRLLDKLERDRVCVCVTLLSTTLPMCSRDCGSGCRRPSSCMLRVALYATVRCSVYLVVSGLAETNMLTPLLLQCCPLQLAKQGGAPAPAPEAPKKADAAPAAGEEKKDEDPKFSAFTGKGYKLK